MGPAQTAAQRSSSSSSSEPSQQSCCRECMRRHSYCVMLASNSSWTFAQRCHWLPGQDADVLVMHHYACEQQVVTLDQWVHCSARAALRLLSTCSYICPSAAPYILSCNKCAWLLALQDLWCRHKGQKRAAGGSESYRAGDGALQDVRKGGQDEAVQQSSTWAGGANCTACLAVCRQQQCVDGSQLHSVRGMGGWFSSGTRCLKHYTN